MKFACNPSYNSIYETDFDEEPVYQKITRTKDHSFKRDTFTSKARKQDYSKQRELKKGQLE